MAELKLKSKCMNVVDYKTIDISEFAIPLSLDEARLERDINNFRKRFATNKQEEIVEKGDILTLSCTSDVPKFQKEHLKLRVGLGLFAKALELQLIGLSCPGEYDLTVNDTAVKVKLESNLREYLPELTEELAANSGMDDIHTVEDVYNWCKGLQFDKQLEDAADNAMSYLAGYVMNHSEFELDEEEKALAFEQTMKNIQHPMALEGRAYDSVSEEEFEAAFGVSRAVLEDSLRMTAEYTLKSAVIGQFYKEKKGQLSTEEDYEKYLQKFAASAEEITEQLRAEHPMTLFLLDEYCNDYLETTEKYVFKTLRGYA